MVGRALDTDPEWAALEADVPPPLLYKYRSLAGESLKFVERAFTHGEMYYASVVELNDPFECRPHFTMDGTKQQLRRYLEDIAANARELTSSRARKEFVASRMRNRPSHQPATLRDFALSWQRRIEKEAGIFCMTSRPDHILMWGHYADCHRGVCLVFDTQLVGSPFRNAARVYYQREYPTISLIAGAATDKYKRGICTKALEWEYEAEWRLADLNGPSARRSEPRHLVGVILGARISPDHRSLVTEWANAHSTSVIVSEAQLEKKKYAISIIPAR